MTDKPIWNTSVYSSVENVLETDPATSKLLDTDGFLPADDTRFYGMSKTSISKSLTL